MKHSPDNLEKFIHQTLRALPDRRAPHSLEARVLAEIARRAGLPWWKQSYAQWPLAARCAFLLGSAGFVKLALVGTVWIMAGFDSVQFAQAFATPVAWMLTAQSVAQGTGDFFAVVFRNVPPFWLYGSLAFLATMYAALFGLGAAAYRLLWSRQ